MAMAAPVPAPAQNKDVTAFKKEVALFLKEARTGATGMATMPERETRKQAAYVWHLYFKLPAVPRPLDNTNETTALLREVHKKYFHALDIFLLAYTAGSTAKPALHILSAQSLIAMVKAKHASQKLYDTELPAAIRDVDNTIDTLERRLKIRTCDAP